MTVYLLTYLPTNMLLHYLGKCKK